MKPLLRAESPAKINLFLHIVGRRADGYHQLESIFCPISLCDHIELALQPSPNGELQIERHGDLLHIPPEKDLTVKACRRFFEAAKNLGAWAITLKVSKQIPEEAGLGGGSSNAATVLKLLQQHFDQPLNASQLQSLALSLGADVPFFLQGQTAFVEGIGETLTPISGVNGHVLVFKPPISCSTQQIFADPELTRDAKGVKIAVFDSARRTENGNLLSFIGSSTCNALQTVVEKHKSNWKLFFDHFREATAGFHPVLVRMTGSGSAMFAVFASPSQLSDAMAAVAGNPVCRQGQCFKAQVL